MWLKQPELLRSNYVAHLIVLLLSADEVVEEDSLATRKTPAAAETEASVDTTDVPQSTETATEYDET